MLIDINAYVGHWPFKQLQYNTCSKLLERMNRFGVDISVISNLNGIFYKNTQSANEELYNEIKSDRNFKDGLFLLQLSIRSMPDGGMILKHVLTKMGMKGIRLYPQYHDYEITDPSLIELVKLARDHGFPVAFDIRMVDSRQRSWMDIPVFDYNATVKTDIIFKEWNLQNIIPIIKRSA